MSTLSEEMRK